MINTTIISRQAVGKVVSYYADGADDYYAKDGSAMQWEGKGAEALGLEGDVDEKRFRQLLDGKIDEHTQLKRTPPGGAYKERLGVDLTFSAPKGVTLQALVHGDQRIVEAHDKAVSAAIREAERLSMARTTVNGKTTTEHTNNLVVAKFRHETSRALDPDLHTHAFVLNMTQRGDGQWRALTNDGVIKSAAHLGNVYKAELAKELQKQGFELRYDKNGTFDLAHFSPDQIRQFSQRSQQIEEALAKKGLDRSTATQAEKNQASLATRDKKRENVDRQELHATWQTRAKDLGIDFDRREWAGPGAEHQGPETSRQTRATPQLENPTEFHADKSVKHAISSLTERRAIVTLDELQESALKQGMGAVGIEDIRAALDRRVEGGHLIREEPVYVSADAVKKAKDAAIPDELRPVKGQKLELSTEDRRRVAFLQREAERGVPKLTPREWADQMVKAGRSPAEAKHLVDVGIRTGRLQAGPQRFTTVVAMRRERSILQMERQGRGTRSPAVAKEKVQAFLKDRTLNSEQGRSVERIATSRNQFMGVQGLAGVGKSFMTTAARDLLEENGYRVTSLAPYGMQKKALEAEGLEARTVSAFLHAKDKRLDEKTVVFVDEAGVIPARQMEALMKVIQESGARAVLLGDTEQTKAIEAGKPFDQLQKAGMETSRLENIQRQKDPQLLEAVKLAAQGESAKSLAKVSQILVEQQQGPRLRGMVEQYASLTPDERNKTLIITGTNHSRRELNAGIREALELTGKGRDFMLYERVDTTQAERRHSRYFEVGQVIVPEKDYSNGLKKGESYTVVDTGPGNRLTVKNKDEETIQFSPSRVTKLDVYNPEKTELAAGDWIKVTRNNKDLQIDNGDRFQVLSVAPGKIVVQAKDREIELTGKAKNFVSLAYASTVHSAQGLTTDRVMINLDSKSPTTSKDVYYVAISRARHEAVIYTDNDKDLAKSVKRDAQKNSALEIKQLRPHAREEKREVAKEQNQVERNGPQVDNALERSKQRDRSDTGRSFGL